MTLKYDTYKDSGVQWLGMIPGHWEVCKMKYLFTERSEKNHPEEQPLCATQSRGVIPQSLYDSRVVVVNKGFENLKLVKVGDFVISLRSFQGGIEYAYYQGIISAAYTILEVKNKGNADYFKLLFKCHEFIQLLQTCVTGIREGQNINYQVLSKKFIILPPLSEQRAIVSYLDVKCSQLDKLVSAKEAKIALLGEMKQRIISDAVTRGLNPNVKLKATNIPWLKEVPEHWEVKRLKNLFKQRNESYNPNEQLIILSLLKDVGVIPYSEKGNVGNKSKEDYSSYNIARKGDIVMNSMNVIIGSVDITPYDGYISPAYYALTARDGVSTEYYNYLFHLKAVQKTMRTLANGILEIRLRISTTNLFGMSYPVPPLSEQRAIVSRITSKTSKLDALVEKLQAEIAHIKEYKQRLISDVVTGQIKVC